MLCFSFRLLKYTFTLSLSFTAFIVQWKSSICPLPANDWNTSHIKSLISGLSKGSLFDTFIYFKAWQSSRKKKKNNEKYRKIIRIKNQIFPLVKHPPLAPNHPAKGHGWEEAATDCANTVPPLHWVNAPHTSTPHVWWLILRATVSMVGGTCPQALEWSWKNLRFGRFFWSTLECFRVPQTVATMFQSQTYSLLLKNEACKIPT